LIVESSTFQGNTAFAHGGGVYHYGAQLLSLTSSAFNNNSALLGGGIYSRKSKSPPLIKTTSFMGNMPTDKDVA
jgi:predicted outer membrane repeat protein